MSNTVCILGRQPSLGLAELESLFGADNVRPVGQQAAEVSLDSSKVSIIRLGGTLKVCKQVAKLPFADWRGIEKYLSENIEDLLTDTPEGKLKLGISAYGFNIEPRQINASAISLKKIIKSLSRSVRVIPNSTTDLSTAQTIHNNLVGRLGMELVFIADGNQTVMAQVIAVQDIAAYAARDQARPKRDARVGMLPPKLAQMIINLADPAPGDTVLDPFCGTGVILQEAALMGFNIYGTDLEPRMVEYSEANMDWLRIESIISRVRQADATVSEWEKPFDVMATETYLGRPFSSMPADEILQKVLQDVNTIHRKFLLNVFRQTESGFRMCLAIPAWKTENGFRHLPVLDQLTDMGYTRQSFVHASTKDLIYYRPNQIVARELVVLKRT